MFFMLALLRNIKKQHYITLMLLVLVYTGVMLCSGFSKANAKITTNNLSDSGYAGTAACMNCHKAVYDSFMGTAHYITSRPAASEFIKGSFEEGKNHFTYNQFVDVKLEKTDSGFFQTVYVNGSPTHSEAMDIVVGSGRKGQTYLFWNDNLLYQLPVSYYVPTKSWCNSPGYPLGFPRFSRLISARCFECHASNAVYEDAGKDVNYFDKESVLYGISCERCHGPSADHVSFHQAHPKEKNAMNILHEKSLNRQQKLDLCALCHSGIRTAIKPVFSYKAGDKLEDFSLPKYNEDSAAMLDVHGNQYGLLTSSKCFKNSQMTCSSCHNTHGREAQEMQGFSQRCIGCHNSTTKKECTVKQTAGIVLSENCVDCHMPSLPSKKIFLQTADRAQSSADFVRSHRIAIYPEAVKEFMKRLKEKQRN